MTAIQFEDLQFVKWGGSLITDKTTPSTPRPEVLARLSQELAAYRRQHPQARLLLGHGSGSFGHVPARRYRTRQGVRTPQEWLGFVEVWQQAAGLNRLVMAALQAAGLAAIAFQPSAAILAEDGRIAGWDLRPLEAALQANLIPVIYGDVIFDRQRGGTILSTEDLFEHLAPRLRPERVLLAGIEPGVWADYPECTRIIPAITPASLPAVEAALQGSAATDVTGGMDTKVRQGLALVEATPGLEVLIFSGETPGALLAALQGRGNGTHLAAG